MIAVIAMIGRLLVRPFPTNVRTLSHEFVHINTILCTLNSHVSFWPLLSASPPLLQPTLSQQGLAEQGTHFYPILQSAAFGVTISSKKLDKIYVTILDHHMTNMRKKSH